MSINRLTEHPTFSIRWELLQETFTKIYFSFSNGIHKFFFQKVIKYKIIDNLSICFVEKHLFRKGSIQGRKETFGVNTYHIRLRTRNTEFATSRNPWTIINST